MKLKDGIYYMNAEEARKVRPFISGRHVCPPGNPTHRWTVEIDGDGLRFPCIGDQPPPGPSVFRDDMARYGITVEEEAKAAPSPSRIDKHAVADAIEQSVRMCLDGTHTGEIQGCPVCRAMGYDGRDRDEHGVSTRAKCKACPLGPNTLPETNPRITYGCAAAADDIKAKKPGAVARVFAIVDALRSTTGDDRWIEIAPKKKGIRRADLADAIERDLAVSCSGSGSRCGDWGGDACRVVIGSGARGACPGLCPLTAGKQSDDVGCGPRRSAIEAKRPGWTDHVVKVAKAISDLRSQGGEIEA